MARRKSLDSAFASMIEAVVRESVREQLAPLRREIADLRRAVSRSNGKPKSSGKGRPGRKPLFTVCQVVECRNRHQSRGLCQRHYNRLRNRGTLEDWTRRIQAGETVRESMIAPLRNASRGGSRSPGASKRKGRTARK